MVVGQVLSKVLGLARRAENISRHTVVDASIGTGHKLCNGLDKASRFLYDTMTRKATDSGTYIAFNNVGSLSLAGIGGIMTMNHLKIARDSAVVPEDAMPISEEDNHKLLNGAIKLLAISASPFLIRIIPGLSTASGVLGMAKNYIQSRPTNIVTKTMLLGLSPLAWSTTLGAGYGFSYLKTMGTASGDSWLSKRTWYGLPVTVGAIEGSKDFGLTTRMQEIMAQRKLEATQHGVYKPTFSAFDVSIK